MKESEYEKRVEAIFSIYPIWFDPKAREVSMFGFPAGWLTIIEELLSSLDELLTDEQSEHFRISQTKEKFGLLNVYWHTKDAEKYPRSTFIGVDDLIDAAMEKSAVTCIFCGDVGKLRRQAWQAVMCDYHHAIYQKDLDRLFDDFELKTTPAPKV